MAIAPTITLENAWSKTYQCMHMADYWNDLRLSITTAIHADGEKHPPGILCAISARTGEKTGITTDTQINLTPAQMRELAALLTERADHVEKVLQPALAALVAEIAEEKRAA